MTRQRATRRVLPPPVLRHTATARRRRRSLGARLAALPVMAVLWSGPVAGQETSINSIDWSGTIPAGATLTIADMDGEIRVMPATGPTAEVHGERTPGRWSRGDVVFERVQTGNDVTICAYLRDRGSCGPAGVQSHEDDHYGPTPSASFVVHLPAGVRVRTESGDGRIEVRGATAAVAAHTGDGEITIDEVQGPVHASTGDGRITITASTGPAEASTGDGDIEVRLGAVPPTGTMHFSTGDGNVTLYMPTGFSGELDASTGDGSVSSDFPLEVAGRLDRHHVHAQIGSGQGPRISISTGNGEVAVRRAT